jgi:phosphatidylinositol alpha-1,6-mannosyltransferase
MLRGRPIRLLMLNNEFPPKGGGMGTVNQALLERFSCISNFEIDLITSASENRHEQVPFAKRIRIFKVPVENGNIHHASNKELLEYAYQAFVLARRLHNLNSYDFCFAWSGVPAGGVALALRRLTGLHYLVRVSGPDIPGFERRYQWLYPLITPIIRLIWRTAEVVIAKCEEESEMICRVDRKIHIAIIPNGVDLQIFHPIKKMSMNAHLKILCVARLIERKGQRQLMGAVRRLTDEGIKVKLELVGTGDAEADYKKFARSLGISKLVQFSGYVPREEIAGHYASSDVFVLSSFNEGMSVATLEAMASGLPIVTTRTGGTNDLIEDGSNGLIFDWGDVDSLTAHLRLLAMDKALRKKLGEASRAKASKFSWDAVVENYLKLFCSVGFTSSGSKSIDSVFTG